ncbi:ergot alkaloid A [Ephemerocybe angulata]|uniref:Ergot alkaloid A n=1 Tax=Ephemerocybe angulata TaxID=980116 RepID=A0A8H6I8L5_9AGAR|nr:ergot alkaloid A [Tulosesus angulatus]
MTTLITGGASQSGVALAKLLKASGHPVLFGSRSGRVPEGFDSVKFDFTDASTHETPFAVKGHEIHYVYLLVPYFDPLVIAKPFIDLAAARGVKRFVLMSSHGKRSEKGPDSLQSGKVHTYLDQKGLDYVALRPTWFLENIQRFYGEDIKKRNTFENTMPTGRVPLVAVDDIAKVAWYAITDIEKLKSREPIIVGADLVSYSEIARALTEVLGRTITHTLISKEELIRKYTSVGYPDEFAHYLADVEEDEENGAGEALLQDSRIYTGRVGAQEWLQEHKEDFTPA